MNIIEGNGTKRNETNIIKWKVNNLESQRPSQKAHQLKRKLLVKCPSQPTPHHLVSIVSCNLTGAAEAVQIWRRGAEKNPLSCNIGGFKDYFLSKLGGDVYPLFPIFPPPLFDGRPWYWWTVWCATAANRTWLSACSFARSASRS